MRKSISNEIDQCTACQRYNIVKEGYHPAKSVIAKEPWDHLQIDLIGPLRTSIGGYNYILTVICACTNYTVIRALKNKELETVAKALWMIFCEYGTPRVLQSDQGTEFVNQALEAMKIIYGIDHRLSTAYHPCANGLVERQNKEVSRALKKFTEGTYESRSEEHTSE